MRAVIICTALLVLALSVISSAYTIQVSYPKEVFVGQPFTINFSLLTVYINSTSFQYMTPGMGVLYILGLGEPAYEGNPSTGGYWLVDEVNLMDTSELVVSFYGQILGTLSNSPGIVLYGSGSSSFSLNVDDNDQSGIYGVLTSWSGVLWLNALNGWYQASNNLPTFNAGQYEVVFKDVNGLVYVYSISVNSTTSVINYNTGIPWNVITYVGVRPDTDTVLPLGFSVVGIPSNPEAYYVIYINGSEYASGYTNSEGYSTLSLTLYGPTLINITFPQYHVYKVISIIPRQNSSSTPSSTVTFTVTKTVTTAVSTATSTVTSTVTVPTTTTVTTTVTAAVSTVTTTVTMVTPTTVTSTMVTTVASPSSISSMISSITVTIALVIVIIILAILLIITHKRAQ